MTGSEYLFRDVKEGPIVVARNIFVVDIGNHSRNFLKFDFFQSSESRAM